MPGIRAIIVFTGLICLASCIDPYPLNLTDYESLLVVDALITDRDEPYTVNLSKTFQSKDSDPEPVSGAEVRVSGDDGSTVTFSETSPGVYTSNPPEFRGQPGVTYTLQIRNGSKYYESDPCTMLPPVAIDSVIYNKDREFLENGSIEADGLRISVAVTNPSHEQIYLRWDFTETWKIKMPYPRAFAFLGGSSVIAIPVENDICWKEEDSYTLTTRALPVGQEQPVIQPLNFIAPSESDRLTQQYSILVRQYSISQQEFDFWENLKQVSEERGDIFDKQPYFVAGNIHATDNNGEVVLGFFRVSSVSEQRIFITKEEIRNLKLPRYYYNCEVVEIGPNDYSQGAIGRPTFDYLYDLYTLMGYVFVYPVYDGLALERLAFVKPVCSDCSLSADPARPEFWIDLP